MEHIIIEPGKEYSFKSTSRCKQITNFYLQIPSDPVSHQQQDFLLVAVINTKMGDQVFHRKLRPGLLEEVSYFPVIEIGRINSLRRLELYHPEYPEVNLLAADSTVPILPRLTVFYH